MQIRNFYKNYSSSREDVLFEDLSLKIAKAQVTALFGPSGCGKSTLLNVLAGLDHKYGGQIISGEKDKIDYIPQQNSLLPWLNVRENIEFGLKIMKFSAKKDWLFQAVFCMSSS